MQATATRQETIRLIMASDQFDASERWCLKWQCNLLSRFNQALATAISYADTYNLERLRAAFPVEVNGYERWALGVEPKIAPRLRAAGLEI